MAPPLPRPVGRRSFLKQTVAEWESWPWDTWNPSQVAHATRTIVLIDDLNRAATADRRVKLDQPVRQALRVLGLTKKDDEEDEETREARRAEDKRILHLSARVSAQRKAIREGVELHELHRGWRDREGCWHDLRDILFYDIAPDPTLEDERQAQAEADGTWPEVTTTASASRRSPRSRATRRPRYVAMRKRRFPAPSTGPRARGRGHPAYTKEEATWQRSRT
jgi:hypothetical protein